MPATDPGDAGARRGSRVALLGFLVISSAFGLSSAWQLTRASFFAGERPADVRASIDAHGECARALRRLAAGVEHGLAVSGGASTEAAAVASFAAGIAPDWGHADRVSATCAAEPRGADAFAAVERLRRAAEAVAGHRARDLSMVRRDVSGLLGP